MPTEQQTRRKHHAPKPGSKRSQRRQWALDRAAYFDDKQALVLGAPVVTFAGARAVVMRAAFGRESDGRLPDEGLLWDRVDVAIKRYVSKRVQDEYTPHLSAYINDVVDTALGLQQARLLMREIRALRRSPRASGIIARCQRLNTILKDLGRTVPDEFRVD